MDYPQTPTPSFLFDLDGTLIDSVYQHVIAWRAALMGIGINLSVWRIHRRIGMSGGLFVHALLRETGRTLSPEDIEQLQLSHAEEYRKQMGSVTALPGARALLTALTEAGAKWAIATSGRAATARPALELLGLPEDTPMVTRDLVRHAKPDPDLFLAAASLLDVEPRYAMVVGDSVWDMLAARRAGALGIGVLSGGYGREELERSGAYRVYADPAEMLARLDEAGVRLDEAGVRLGSSGKDQILLSRTSRCLRPGSRQLLSDRDVPGRLTSYPDGDVLVPDSAPVRSLSLKGLVMATIYQHIRHPRIAERLADRPVRVSDMLPRGTAISRFNTKVALIITTAVGSMWCAYAFALFDLISLPDAIRAGASAIVSWVAQTFLQLVLLSVIMVGQNVQAAAADKRAEATFHDASATLHEVAHVQGHLAAQDELLTKIAAKLGLDPVPVIDPPPDEVPIGEDSDDVTPEQG